jgi:HPt (histidine-containing phosphotransfer) domain-containing protein
MRLHTLKGNAGTLGATALAEKASKLEKLCATGAGMQECEEGLDRFEMLIRSTQKTLNEAIAALESQSPNTRPVPASTSGQPVSAEAIAALGCIAELAKASDLEALLAFGQARDLLSALPLESVEALDLALQGLDLEKAGALCDELLSGLHR